MKDIKDIAVLIQARLSSERCPQKMIRPFAGSSLVEIASRKVLDSKLIPNENFYLSVYEPELQAVGHRLGANIFERGQKSALWDGRPKEHLTEMYEWWNKIPFEYVVMINACVPLLKIETIDNFVKAYMKSTSDGMFAVMEKMNYFWNKDKKLITPLRAAAMNTKDVDTVYEGAHCLYASRLSTIGDGIWMGDFRNPGEIELYPVHERECYDIDYEWQFNAVEALYNHEKEND